MVTMVFNRFQLKDFRTTQMFQYYQTVNSGQLRHPEVFAGLKDEH